MSDTYVLVHGAWHTGAELEAAAEHVRRAGHTVHCPTLVGNRTGDDRSKIGLADASASLAGFITTNNLRDVRLAGHSYGGMTISAAHSLVPDRIKRLVYVNAFVPLPGESMLDMVPPHYKELFEKIAATNDNAVTPPPPQMWREAFINDADEATAMAAHAKLNPQPFKTFSDHAKLKQPLHEAKVGKSYINCVMDAAMPHSFPWHPRLSERLGLFRYIACSGSHSVWVTDPAAIAKALILAGRD